jgi:hypothetical protein
MVKPNVLFGPCRDWGKKSVLVHGTRQYCLEEMSGWVGKGNEVFEGLGGEQTLKSAVEYTWSRTKSGDIVSQEFIDSKTKDKEFVDTRQEEGMRVVMTLLNGGGEIDWVQELDEQENPALNPPTPTQGASDGTLEGMVANLAGQLDRDEEMAEAEAEDTVAARLVGLAGSRHADPGTIPDSEEEVSDDGGAGKRKDNEAEARRPPPVRIPRTPMPGFGATPRTRAGKTLMYDSRHTLDVLQNMVDNGNLLKEITSAGNGSDEDNLARCIELKIDADGIMLEVRESRTREEGGTLGGWDVMRREAMRVGGEATELGFAIIEAAHAAYLVSKDRKISREKYGVEEKLSHVLEGVRVIADLSLLVAATQGIGSVEDAERVEKARNDRREEERHMEEKKSSRRAVEIHKRKENEDYERTKRHTEAAEEAEKKHRVEIERKKTELAALNQAIADKKSKLEIIKENASAEETLQVAAEVQNAQRSLEETAKKHAGVVETNVGGGFMVVEGISHKSVEITSHFVSDLTDDERKGLPNAIVKVASMLSDLLESSGFSKWGLRAEVDGSVCKREIVWTVSKVPYKLIKKEDVVKRMREQLELVYAGRVNSVWCTNRLSFPVFVHAVERAPRLMGAGIVDKALKEENTGVKWGNRSAYFTTMGLGIQGVKMEVVNASEAERIINDGLVLEGRKLRVVAWKWAGPPPATRQWNKVGQDAGTTTGTGPQQQRRQYAQPAAQPSPTAYPRGPAADRSRQGQNPPRRMMSSVQCYNCQKFGHFARVCTGPSRRAAGGVVPRRSGNRGTPPPAQGTKRPAVSQIILKPGEGSVRNGWVFNHGKRVGRVEDVGYSNGESVAEGMKRFEKEQKEKAEKLMKEVDEAVAKEEEKDRKNGWGHKAPYDDGKSWEYLGLAGRTTNEL